MEEIILKIEELREELNKLSSYRRLVDPEVIRASQLLDDVLNTYNLFLHQKITE
ncbi:Spo0E family sporulation regulatory protein-aspartic acid phosphatase [Paenibacillus sp. sgz500958]|uniref:Spo0E family sporulation regulatory protein-aspartic acid phosphatase n=1 Tax=Paenibacillus sp. sgz500958 TaxID=3242475 RepID=UPI0036D2FBED